VGEVYTTIREELGKYDKELLAKKEIVVLSKIDTITKDEVKKKQAELAKVTKGDVYTLSLYDDESVKSFGDSLIKKLS
jgi:GTPase involved in cell partitioning and DNA repair